MPSNDVRASLSAARAALRAEADPRKSGSVAMFFKTGPGEYGEGDRFLGVSVPAVRRALKSARALDDAGVEALLDSRWHEERLLGVLILTERARGADAAVRRAVMDFYLRRLDAVNNWDLVDASAHLIVGPAVEAADGGPTREGRELLLRLSRSKRLWDRRVAVLATFHFTRRSRFEPLLELSARLLDDPEDLMHKAVGWMLREAGKRDAAALRGFLKKHADRMPRTMLRYAIERLPEAERRRWMESGR